MAETVQEDKVEESADELDQEKLAAAWDAGLAGEDISEDGVGSQWANMIESSGLTDEGLSGSASRLVKQDEVDSLLGFNFNEQDAGLRSGTQAIIDSPNIAYERLPMLEIVFDRLVRLLTTSLRNFTSDNVEVTLESVRSARFAEYIDSIPLPAILSVFSVEQWEHYGLVTTGSELVYSMIDVLLGGARVKNAHVEGRPFTQIELELVNQMINLVMKDFEQAFNPVVKNLKMMIERMETNPRFASIVRPANAVIVAKLRIDIEDRSGLIEIILPFAMIEPIRKQLMQMYMGEKFGNDSAWEGHMATQIWRSSVDVRAILFEDVMPMNKIYNLKLGDTLLLEQDENELVTLRCGNWELTSGSIGCVKDKVAVRLEKPLNYPKTTLSSLYEI